MRGSYIHAKSKPVINAAASQGAPDYSSQVKANLRVGLSLIAVGIVLNQHSRYTEAWKLAPKGEYDDDVQQALSDNSVEAAPSLSHPAGSQKDVLVTVLAGGVSGAVAKTAMAPFSRLTILYQVQALQSTGSKAPGLLAALKQVIRQEGVLSLWKGNLATIIHRVPYSATNFTVFEYTKQALGQHFDDDVARRLIAGAASGLVACTVAYPLDLVRTRLAAQRDMLPHATRLTQEAASHLGVQVDTSGRKTPANALPHTLKPPKNYRGIRHAFKCIVREEGLRGLYRGLNATLLQVTPSLALNFALYDSFKSMYLRSTATTTTDSLVQPSSQPHQRSAAQDDHSSAGHREAQVTTARQQAISPGHTQSQEHDRAQKTPQGVAHHAVDGQGSTQTQPGIQARSFVTVQGHRQAPEQSAVRLNTVGAGHAQGEGYRQGQGQGQGPVQGQGQGQGQTQWQGQGEEQGQGQAAVHLGVTGSLVCAASAGFIASTVTFPLDVVRKQLQTNRGPQASTSFTQACHHIWQRQGVRGFYSGIIPEYCKVLPGMAIAFGLYEGIRQAFGVPPS